MKLVWPSRSCLAFCVSYIAWYGWWFAFWYYWISSFWMDNRSSIWRWNWRLKPLSQSTVNCKVWEFWMYAKYGFFWRIGWGWPSGSMVFISFKWILTGDPVILKFDGMTYWTMLFQSQELLSFFEMELYTWCVRADTSWSLRSLKIWIVPRELHKMARCRPLWVITCKGVLSVQG